MFSYAPHYQILLLVYKRRHLDCVVSFLSEQAANVASSSATPHRFKGIEEEEEWPSLVFSFK